MTTNSENNTNSRVTSLDFQDSNLKINRNVIGSVSPLINTSQRGIKRGWAVDRELKDLVVNQPQTKDTTPRPIKEEINQLAKSWCELLVGQMQENTINKN